MKRHAIEREHPEYTGNKEMWRRYRDIYAGGEQFRMNAGEYLVQRHREPTEIYRERLDRVFYENYVGSIVDWYAATLMRREPLVLFEGTDDSARSFFSTFSEDCDLKGTNLPEFFRQQFINALVYGRSHVVVDFPRASGSPATRAEEDAIGRSRAYLLEYTPEDLINWSYDEDGNLDWAVIRSHCLRVCEESEHGWRTETRWMRYDRHSYQLYRDTPRGPELFEQGPHGLCALETVPVFTLKLSGGLWLVNKAALLQLEHFNKSNALAWALTMGLFAMPVIYSDREWNQMVGESYFVQLGPEDRFGWTEPTGHVYQIAADNLDRLKDEIYRVCYLVSQAVSPEAAVRQSGVSKQRDQSVTQEVLRAYGDSVKELMTQVLHAILAARQDSLTVDVTGLDSFDIADFRAEVDDARSLLDMDIGSETLKKQVFKKLALKYLCDASQEVKSQIAREIEAG